MEANEVFSEIITDPGFTRVRELIQDHFMFVRADRDGHLNATCLETFSLALREGGHHVPELLVEYEERLLEFRHRDVHPKLRYKSLLCLARYLPKLRMASPAERQEHLKRAVKCATEVLQTESRRRNPSAWGEAQVLIGRVYLHWGSQDDAQTATTCATRALSVLRPENSPSLVAEARQLLATAFALLFAFVDNPSDNDVDAIIATYETALARFRQAGQSEGVKEIELALEKIHTRRKTQRQAAAQPAVGTVFCLEVAVSLLVPEDNPSLWAWTRFTLGHSYLNYLEKRGRSFEPAQSALRSFSMAADVLKPNSVSWALANQGIAHAMTYRMWDRDDLRKASWTLQTTNYTCPIDPLEQPYLYRMLKYAPATPDELAYYAFHSKRPIRALRHGHALAASM
jgi:hypothetical protein